jgi:hypothetical protein
MDKEVARGVMFSRPNGKERRISRESFSRYFGREWVTPTPCLLALWLRPRGGHNLPRNCRSMIKFALERHPHPSLLSPIERGDEEADVGFLDNVAAALGARQEQELFLEVGSQVQERHDLRHARRRDLAETGQLRLVGHDPIVDQLLATDGQGH